MVNPASIFKLKGLWEKFTENHPKFPMFLKAAASSNISAGTVIEMHIVTADGKTLDTNVKLSESDMELIQQLKEIAK